MGKVLAIANQKGGVGKTTTTVNLAASLAATKRKVLLIDLDPQGNATMGSGVDKSQLEFSVYELLTDRCNLEQALRRSEEGGYDLLPANADLTAAEVELLELKMKESRLRYALANVRDKYDFILIDCPPSLNMLTVNALVAADLALAGCVSKIPADECIMALDKVGKQMPTSLRETGLGGLAGTPTGQAIKAKIFGHDA